MDGPVALVTGGGSGIGLAVASHLVNFHGYRVAIVDIDEKRVKDEAANIDPHKVLPLQADVAQYDQQAKAFLHAFEWGGNRLDLLFLNAGIGESDSLYKDLAMNDQTMLPKPLDLRTIDVNLSAVIQGTHLARHFFSEKNNSPGGRVVITSSVAGLYPLHTLPLYAAAKHGLVGLVRSLAPIYLKDKITINALNPTLVYTNLMPKEVAEEFHVPEQTTPMSTVLKAFDAILADDKITGQTMELTLDDVVLKAQPEYSRPNIRWMFDQRYMWEKVCEPLMPRKPGENAAQVEAPTKSSF